MSGCGGERSDCRLKLWRGRTPHEIDSMPLPSAYWVHLFEQRSTPARNQLLSLSQIRPFIAEASSHLPMKQRDEGNELSRCRDDRAFWSVGNGSACFYPPGDWGGRKVEKDSSVEESKTLIERCHRRAASLFSCRVPYIFPVGTPNVPLNHNETRIYVRDQVHSPNEVRSSVSSTPATI